MAKRVSKKLLLGLGSTLTFGTVGVVGGFGIKSIVDVALNNQINQFSFNSLSETAFTNAPDYNVATGDMFVDTTNLKRFHFGNTLIGQTVTPYGWLGVFEESDKSSRIALTGWNGEVLWVNEPVYGTSNKHNYDVYDMEYDFKNDLIFVLRTWSSNGFINDRDEGLPEVRLDILDAKTGKAYEGSRITWIKEATGSDLGSKLKEWQKKALKALKDNKYINWGNSANRDQSRNLYQLDLASAPEQKNLLLTWMPDFMRLTKNFGDEKNASSITLNDFFKLWPEVAVSLFILPENIRQNKAAEISRYFDLSKSDQIDLEQGNFNIEIDGKFQASNQYYLIANPFFTVGKDNENEAKPFYIMHILFADKNGNVYHKTMAWLEDLNQDAKGVPYKKWKYDKMQKIDWKNKDFGDGGGILVEAGKDGNAPSWTNRVNYTSPQIINANTRINKNMFDGNSIVFAHPFGAATNGGKRFPIFNVAQMYVEPLTGAFYSTKDSKSDLKKIPRQFYFGRDIANKNKEMAHYPGANGKNNINQTYHRLISVSPFDNTFIYSEKPNINHPFFAQGANDNIKDWAGFFVGKVFRNSNDVVRPFFIWNSNGGGSSSAPIDTSMTSFEKLYEDGFTFDLKSFVTSTSNGARTGLNLYFNQNGNPTGTAASQNTIRSRKIGMISDVFSKIDNSGLANKLWIGNGELATALTLTNPGQFYSLAGAKINSNSFSTINHSRVDLEKWYPRTLFNNISPSNLLSGNVLLNNSANEHTRAIATRFSSKLTGADFDTVSDSKKSIDMVSAWENNSNNYNRLIIKRPEIKVKNQSIAEKLPITTTYNYVNENDLKSNIWIPKDSSDNLIKNNLVITKEQDLSNVSFKILSSWKEQFRMQSIGTETNNLNPLMTHKGAVGTWIDERNKGNNLLQFGRFNNALVNSQNQEVALRLFLKIVKPTSGNLPTWFNNLDSNFFKAYPVKRINSSETQFSEILNAFIEQKTRLLDMSDNNQEAVGLGNLQIQASLELNPAFLTGSDNKIYKDGNKKIIRDSNGKRIIYEDLYTGNRDIYNQSKKNYKDFNLGGFGNEVKPVVQESWLPTVNSTNKIKVNVDGNLLKDTLLRKDANNQKLFDFDYEQGNPQFLVIKPVDKSWLRSRLLNFQRLINMTLRFEYQTETSTTWQTLVTVTDERMATELWPSDTETFKLPTSGVRGINKLRLVLSSNLENDANSFVKMTNATGNKFISSVHTISTQKVVINKNWFDQVFLSNSSSSLNNLTVNDLNNFENNIFNLMPELAANPNLRTKIKLVYKWNNESQTLEKQDLVNKIVNAFRKFDASDGGVFALWNGTNGIKIRATFVALDNSIQFIKPDQSIANQQDYSDIAIKSNIKSELNLGSYISVLQSAPLSAQSGSAPGTIVTNSIVFPVNSGTITSEKFGGRDFAKIKQLLSSVGISIKFKQWDGNNWSNWLDNENQIVKYNVAKPEFQIAFDINQNWNVKLLNGQNEIPNLGVYTLSLNLPKVVRIDGDAVTTFRNSNPFSGNTKKVVVDQNKIDKLINDIKISNLNNNVSGINDVPLQLEYRLGNSGDFKILTEWKDILDGATSDQVTNQIQIKFSIDQNATNASQWILENADGIYTGIGANNTWVPIFVHDAGIEEAIKTSTRITGDSNEAITINFPTENGFTVNTSNQISGSKGNGLKIQFSLDESLDVDAPNGWLDQRPTSVPVGTKKIFMRIVPINGQYVYEKKVINQYVKIQINFNIAQKLTVKKEWINNFQLGGNSLELNLLNETKINEWIAQIQAEVKKYNSGIDDATSKKVTINFSYNGSKDYVNAAELLKRINADKGNSTNLGIVQLWNGSRGTKINAKFVAVDNTVLIQDTNGTNVNLSDDILTNNIYTEVDLSSYVNILETKPTSVDRGNNPPGQMVSFTPPTMIGNTGQFAGKTYDEISARLEQIGISALFKQPDNQWVAKDVIRTYDPNSAILPLAFSNIANNNIRLKIKNAQFVETGNNNQQNPINLILAVPRQFNINAAAIDNFRRDSGIGGNTKIITFNETKINKLINDLKAANQGSANAKLEVMFRLGSSGNFELKDRFIENLKNAPNDQTTNSVQISFAINQNDQTNWFIANDQSGPYTILNEGNLDLKIFINDRNIFEDIKTKTRLNGSNNALQVQWPPNFIVNETSGNLTVNNEVKGVGLRLEFTFKDNLSAVNGQTGNNPQNEWVRALPKVFDVNANQNLYIRFQVTDANKYVYEKAPKLDSDKITLSLTDLFQTIILDGAWLNQKFAQPSNNQTVNVENLTIQDFQQYEDLVFAQMTNISAANKKKIKIVYQFNIGNENEFLSKEKALEKIKNYKNNPDASNKNFGILKLWNQYSGEKIIASFAKADENGNYEFSYVDNNVRDKVLDTFKVITTIDLRSLVNWLSTIAKVTVIKNTSSIQLQFPEVNLNDQSPFDQKQWTKIEQVLESLDLKVQYQVVDKNVTNPTWNEDLSSITSYDGRAQFKIRFVLSAPNGRNMIIKIKDNETLSGSSTNESVSSEILVNLAVPKKITINPQTVNSFQTNHGFGGNTKKLQYSENNINNLISQIKNDNSSIPDIQNAPLKAEFKLADNNFMDVKLLATTLLNSPNDQRNNNLLMQFSIPADRQNEWIIEPTGQYTILNQYNDVVPIYVHDKGIFEKLKQTIISGTNDALEWRFPTDGGFTIQGDDTFADSSANGKGLRLQFSTRSNPDVNNDSDWQNNRPTSVAIGTQSIFIRIIPNGRQYVYEKQVENQHDKIEIKLSNIVEKINIDAAWLNVAFNVSDVAQITEDKITEYENNVFKNPVIDQLIKNKLEIRFFFNNNSTALTKSQLVSAIKNYTNADTLNILQLFNGAQGVKISATFVKKNPTANYELVFKNDIQYHDIDTKNIKTTINVKEVVEWLKVTKMQIVNNKVQIPQITLTNNQSIFHQKQWNEFVEVLKRLGIKVQYKELTNNASNWSDDLSAIVNYDGRAQFQIRFQLQAQKATNINLIISDNETINGLENTNVDSQPIIVNLKVIKPVTLDQKIIDKFINGNNISGDTKKLEINETNLQLMISEILSKNNTENPGSQPPFTSAPLKVLFTIGRNPQYNSGQWLARDMFIRMLENSPANQISNEISFRFVIETPANQDVEFSVDETQIFTLNQHEIPSQNTKIKYFVHTDDWETRADKLIVTGINTNLDWKFTEAFGANGFSEINQNVFLKPLNSPENALQLHFTIKDNPTYDDPNVSDQIGDLNNKWITVKPTSIPAGKSLKIRIVPNKGFVYEAALPNAITAKVHNVTLNIQTQINVNKNWLNEILIVSSLTEISNFNETLVNQWISKIENKIQTENQIDLAQAQKVGIKFSFNGANDLNVKQLIAAINEERQNYAGDNLGIVQLWNGQSGIKINAQFYAKDNSIILNPNVPDQISADLDTKNVYTEIDLKAYVNVLKTQKTTINEKDPNNPYGIKKFTPPGMPQGTGFLAGRDFDKISTRLAQVGIDILFSKEKGANANWVRKDQIDNYNPAIAKLFLAFINKPNNNIKLIIDNSLSIETSNDNKANPIELQLNVPKQINIKDTDLNNFGHNINFTDNTKKINFSDKAVNDLIRNILERNSNEANGDQSFIKAPLFIEFQIGNSDWKKSDQLKNYLSTLDTDLISRSIKYRFKLDQSGSSDWELAPGSEQERVLYQDDNSPLKIYINDNEIFKDLGETKFGGTNEALIWKWKQGISVDANNGQLRKNLNNKTSGVGLKVAYSFNKTDWTNTQPQGYNQNLNKVYLKIELEDATRYTYEKVEQIIELTLDLPVNIRLESQWLNQNLFDNTNPISVNEFLNKIEQILDQYEQKVKEQAKQNGIGDQILTKFKIQYIFDNDNNPLDKAQFISKIKNYSVTNVNDVSLGILQLWNGQSGIQIKSQFSDADPTDNFHIIVSPNENPVLLDTTKVETTIDFSAVLSWLTSAAMKIPIEEGTIPNSINKIKIPNTSGLSNSTFNNREWITIEKALNHFGITIQYQPDGNVNGANWGPLSSIKFYDPASGQIQFKFIFDKAKAKNIKLKLDNNLIHNGATTDQSAVYKFQLEVKLNLQVDPSKIQEFIKNASINGDTKFIKFNQSAETNLINAIKAANAQINPEFNKVNLKVQYYLGNEADPNITWREWSDFQQNLSNQTNDQKTNRVIFRLIVDPSQQQDFAISDQIHVLHDDNLDSQNWTVKYFINAANWEKNADQVEVRGTSSTVIWNYNIFGNSNIVKEPQINGNKIFIKNAHGQKALQVYFSVKPNITYNEANSDNLNEINSKWVSIEPQQFLDDWNVSKLYVKLVPVTGYVYEPAESLNNNNPTARAHEISLRNIKLEIKVNPAVLEAKLNLDASKKYVSDLTKNNIDQFVINALNTITNTNLREKVDVKFKFNSQASLDAQGLFSAIQTFLNKQNNQAKNILQLWNGNQGQKIEAQFVLKENAKDQYILIDSQNSQADANRLVTIDTSAIKTLINLETIVSDLAKLKINVSLPSQSLYDLSPLDRLDMPAIPNSDNSSELQGLTWEQFETKLLSFGVAIEARAKVKQGNTPKPWTSIKNVKEYDDNILALELRFKINSPKGQNIVLSVKANEDVEPTTAEDRLPIFEMSLKAPAKVVVSDALIQTFIGQESFTGNTKKIDINSQPESAFISAIISENIANNPDVFNELTGRLEVQYYLGKNDPNNNSNTTWRSATELQTFLAIQDQDQITNQIWFRLNVKNATDPNGQIFQVDQKAQILSVENISATAKIKIYINETGFTNQIANLKAVGSTDSFTINGLSEWKAKIPKGLDVGYSKENNPDETDENLWNQDVPIQLTSDKKLWVRFKVKDGYVYQNAKQDNDRYSDKHPINTEGIKVIIKLQTEWLNKIIFTGNTKNPIIDEEQVLAAIKAAGVLPTDQPDLIELQYNIKGTSKWLNKDDFQTRLNELNGAKDSNNFILRREELQVRFNIRNAKKNDDYGLNINGENIDQNNRDKFNIQVVDTGRNENFKGYINLDQLNDFIADNFKIIGSTSKPKLIISKRDSLNTSFMPYISDNLFDIQFSTVKNTDGTWSWDQNHTLLKNGQLINEDGLISQGITIGAEKHFAIRFISKDSNYDVYKTDQIKNDGYLLDLTSNVTITVEITNPFTTANKTLGIWTRDQKQAKYNQGQGGFKIVAAESDWIINPDQIQSAQEFLKLSTNLTQVEKDALEFVYHIFPNQPSTSDVNELKAKITNYQDSSWKTFSADSNDWSGDLGLKVGDYVSVALRVKESYTNKTDGAFILKDDDYAMLIPITNDKEPGRVAGYQIDVDTINIQESNVGLFNNEDSTLPPIDGYTSLAKISLDKDEQGQYLGVDLDLQVYSEFYLNKNDEILVAPVSKQRLIKRDSSGSGITNKGNYKDANGQDLTDKEGNTIPILKDANNRLAKPIKGTARLQELDNLGSGEFKLPSGLTPDQNEKLSFFRNQDIDVKLKGRIGQGTQELPDYYANKEKIIELKNLISPRIKFTVDNDKNVKYEWPQEEFNPDQIEYKNSDNTPGAAKDGNAEVATVLKIKRWENNIESVISGSNINEAIEKLNQTLNEDFGGQLRFETIYQQATGNTSTFKDNNIYQLKNLKNRDRITVRIVATNDDLYYTGEPNPLVINVNGLVELAPKQEQLQYLRVEQSGRVDGEGSFRVLATDPSIPGQTNDQVLSGWKFMLRVWSKNKEVKTEWTDDQTRINNLENGDKVEWKLVSADGNPVDKAYYNTVALNHEYDENNHVKYNFAKVNFPAGEPSKQVVESNIGQYPTTDQYPENSGYVIAGLKPVAELFKISSGNLEKIFKVLNPTYVGLNHQGTINFDNQYLNNNYYVNTDGEVYQKLPDENNLLTDDSNNTNELFEISVEQLLENVTFYNQDPILNPYQNGFKFSDNTVNINNHLSNGDQIWAQFNVIQTNSASSLNSGITIKLNTVTGLKNTSDPMSPFWYVLMALAGILTLGTSGIIIYVRARHKKLKGKN